MHSGIFVLNGDSPQDFSEHFFHSRLLLFSHFSEKEHNVLWEIERNSNRKGKKEERVPGNRQWWNLGGWQQPAPFAPQIGVAWILWNGGAPLLLLGLEPLGDLGVDLVEGQHPDALHRHLPPPYLLLPCCSFSKVTLCTLPMLTLCTSSMLILCTSSKVILCTLSRLTMDRVQPPAGHRSHQKEDEQAEEGQLQCKHHQKKFSPLFLASFGSIVEVGRTALSWFQWQGDKDLFSFLEWWFIIFPWYIRSPQLYPP